MHLVTSFGPGGWDLYARRHVETFVEFWPESAYLWVGYHDCERPAFEHPRVHFFNLLDDPTLVEFKAKYGHVNGNTPQGYNYRYDAVKFCHKVWAIVQAGELAQRVGAMSLTWLDGDTFTTSTPKLEEFAHNGAYVDIAYLGRTAIDYAETSFITFNFTQATANFISTLLGQYISGSFLHQREFHDGWLFSRLLETVPVKTINLTPNVPDLDAFSRAPVGKYMTHLKGAKKDEGPAVAPGLVPLKVHPRDCMPDDYTAEHIKANTPQFKKVITQCLPHDGLCVIAASGPSLKEHLEDIKHAQEAGAYVVCVKHSFPILREAGVIPDACLVLDPRPFDGTSTHLKRRSDLLELADNRTTFYVASMTSQEYLPYLESKGCPIVGWHAMTKALQTSGVPITMAIAGGTCSAIRALAVFHSMGFRRFKFYGVDASVASMPSAEELARTDESGRSWWMEVSPDPDGRRKFWSTGEMVALVQDVEMLAKQLPQLDSEVELISPLLAGAVWAKVKPPLPPRKEWKEWLRGD